MMLAHASLALALFLALFPAMHGCTRNSGNTTDNPPGQAATAATEAEAEVKPVPEKEPPAAAPPAMPPLAGPEAVGPARPAAPEEQTKATLEPKPVPSASLPQPRSEPAPPAPQTQPSPEPAGRQASGPSPEPAKAAPGNAAPAKAPERSIAVVGDSLAVGIGMTMAEHMDQYEGVGCHPLGKVSTGLISKKFFDWEKRLAELVATEKLAAVVVMMGGNDANNPIAGKAAGTPEWDAAYRQKAESFLRIAAAAKVKVLWVGLPAMRDPAYGKRVAAVNAAARSACAAVGDCAYMEASDLFTDASGRYVQAKDIGGKTVTLRGKDGVHMTMPGYDLLCRQVLDKLSAEGALR
uniref:Uncharacterized protein n=1 Tax=Desulfovibrio sp. U5L TaxID=596152 RepID=I2Q4U4_9BACT